MNDTIIEKIDRSSCTGCEVCVSSCHTNAIIMEEDEEGFNYPHIIDSKCVKCGSCVRACPVYNNNDSKPIEPGETIVGYAKNEELVESSSSGGFFGILATQFLENNRYVVGVKWQDGFRGTEHIICSNESDLSLIQRSKYIQSKKEGIYREVINLLKKDEIVLFSGCPCEVAAMATFCPKNLRDKLYLVDLVCQGPTSPKAMRQYVDYMQKKYHSSIVSINMRKAIGPWIPQFIQIDFENGKKYIERLYETAIGDAIHLMQRPSCYKCLFVGTGRQSDLTLGDFHGAKKGSSYYHQSGISIANANTDKGIELLKVIKTKNTYWEKGDYNSLLQFNPRMGGTWPEDPRREKFASYIRDYTIIEASKRTRSIKQKVLRKIPWKSRIQMMRLLGRKY